MPGTQVPEEIFLDIHTLEEMTLEERLQEIYSQNDEAFQAVPAAKATETVYKDSQFANRFEILEALGEGTTSTVFLAYDTLLKKLVALKMSYTSKQKQTPRSQKKEGVLYKESKHVPYSNKAVGLLTKKEFNILNDLNGNHAPRAYDYFSLNKPLRIQYHLDQKQTTHSFQYGIVMEYISGVTPHFFLNTPPEPSRSSLDTDSKRVFNDSRWVKKSIRSAESKRYVKHMDSYAHTLLVLYGMISQIGEVLETLHKKGIIHNDLKPSNLILNNGEFYVIDFGLAKQIKTGNNRTTEGTYAYNAPEKYFKQAVSTINQPSDIYSLGVIISQLLTKKHLFAEETFAILDALTPEIREEKCKELVEKLADLPQLARSEIRQKYPHFPGMIAHLVGKTLEPNVQKRYQSIPELKTNAQAFIVHSLACQKTYTPLILGACAEMFDSYRLSQHKTPLTNRYNAAAKKQFKIALAKTISQLDWKSGYKDLHRLLIVLQCKELDELARKKAEQLLSLEKSVYFEQQDIESLYMLAGWNQIWLRDKNGGCVLLQDILSQYKLMITQFNKAKGYIKSMAKIKYLVLTDGSESVPSQGYGPKIAEAITKGIKIYNGIENVINLFSAPFVEARSNQNRAKYKHLTALKTMIENRYTCEYALCRTLQQNAYGV